MKEQAYTLSEIKALMAICNDCDDVDGEGFTRPAYAMLAVLHVFEGDGDTAGNCIRSLADKGAVTFDLTEDAVWVDAEIFTMFC